MANNRSEVKILGRSYPIKSELLDSEAAEQLSKEIQNQVNRYKMTYVDLDNQDCLVMALIENYLDNHSDQKHPDTDTEYRVTKLKSIENLIDKVLK